VLVVHGGAGLDAHAREQASRLAGLGYLVLACDLFGPGVTGDRARVVATLTGLRDDPPKLRRRAQAGLGALAAHPQCDGRTAAVGYCFGGLTALELARGGARLAGVASVHGTLATTLPASEGAIAARILVCHGALDPHVPMAQVDAFVAEMNAARADWQLALYGGAVHGFTHREATGAMPGVAFHPQADARAGQAVRLFLEEVFAA
jgi:dienelactone hydrolase